MAKKEKTYKPQAKGPAFKIFTGVFLTLLIFYVFTVLLLIAFGLLTSLKSNVDFRVYKNVLGLPNLELAGAKDYLLLKNYGDIITGFQRPYQTPAYFKGTTLIGIKTMSIGFMDMLINSLIYCIGGAFFMTLPKLIVGYACSMYRNPFSKFIYMLVVVTMIIPIVGTTPAMLTLMRNTGLYDTFVGNFIQKSHISGMYFLIFYEYYRTIPDTYREAAEIDGASQMRVMVRIYFPLCGKIFFTVFLIHAIELWNDYNTVLLYLPSHPTLTYGVWLATFGNDADRYPATRRIAATMLLAVPTMTIFFIFKDRIMGNLTMGGLKG